LVFAAERAYRTTVPREARPSLLLYLDAPPGSVDVNVHPTKAEVRFRDRFAVEGAVEAAVRQALGTHDSAATLDRFPALPQLRRERPTDSFAPPAGPARDPRAAAAQFALFVAAREPGDAGATEAALPRPDADTAAAASLPSSTPSLWQIHDTYILAETRTGLLIIDQHSAHERILFEQLMRSFEDGSATSQRLLFPLTVRLSPAEYAVAA